MLYLRGEGKGYMPLNTVRWLEGVTTTRTKVWQAREVLQEVRNITNKDRTLQRENITKNIKERNRMQENC